jgi:hypothetical protein
MGAGVALARRVRSSWWGRGVSDAVPAGRNGLWRGSFRGFEFKREKRKQKANSTARNTHYSKPTVISFS